MQGWLQSNSVRANRHWQSGTSGSGFNILSDTWHAIKTAAGVTTWMVPEDDDDLKNSYQLGQSGGGLIGCGSDVGVFKTADSPYTGTGKLYNRTIDELGSASSIYVKYTCVKAPAELQSGFLFAPAQNSIRLRNYTSASAYTTINTYNAGYYNYNVADKPVTATTSGPAYYYVEMSGAGDSVTYTITPQATGGNTLILGAGDSAVFVVGCDSRTLTGSWKWKIEVTI